MSRTWGHQRGKVAKGRRAWEGIAKIGKIGVEGGLSKAHTEEGLRKWRWLTVSVLERVPVQIWAEKYLIILPRLLVA